MSQSPALNLYKGRTTHVRYTPFERRFDYGIFMIDVDIDRLDEAAKASALFSVGNPNLYAFSRKDHGKREKVDLRPWAEAKLAEADVKLDGGAIRLVTFPRGLFYKFAPLSVWFGYGPSGELRGVIYEVNNTFGEAHSYVARASGPRSRHISDKNFHVSPFWDVTGKYRFTVRPLGKTLDLVVDSLVDGERIHMANIKAKRLPATTGNLLNMAVRKPFSAIGVTLGIHWQALKLWRHGAGYRSRPELPAHETTLAVTEDTPETEETQAA